MFSTERQDDIVECPYDKAHRMTRKRLQPHLVKCRLSYPNAELCKCPFNVSHLIPEPEFTHHVSICPDKGLISQYRYNSVPVKIDEEDRKQVVVDCEEDWDESEAKDYDPNNYATQAGVIRNPVGQLPSSRKEFRKNERKRLGDEFDEVETKYIKKECFEKQETERNRTKNSYADSKPSSSSKYCKQEESYEESLKKWSKERKHKTKEIKIEERNSERRDIDGDYKLDEDPYYSCKYERRDY